MQLKQLSQSQKGKTPTSNHPTSHAIKPPPSVDYPSNTRQPSVMRSAISHPRTASPETILQLQQTYGNRAVQRLLANAKQAVPSKAPPIQRLVTYFAKTAVDNSDPTLLNSIDFALKRTNGPVEHIDAVNFQTIPNGETIYIIGHGSAGNIGRDTRGVLRVLLDPDKGLALNQTHTIVLMSCYAGSDTKGGGNNGTEDRPDSSAVAEISKGLENPEIFGLPEKFKPRPNITVIGGKGSTVKLNANGNQIEIIKPGQKAQVESIKAALNKNTNFNISNCTSQFEVWLQTQPTPVSVTDKATKMAEILQPRMLEFVSQLRKAGLLYDPKDPKELDQAIRIFISGKEVPAELKQEVLEKLQLAEPQLAKIENNPKNEN